MNIFLCNRYDSKKENIFILSSKMPLNKDNIKTFKNPLLRNLILEEINNLDKEVTPNIDKKYNQNPEESEELQIIEYPYSPSSSNINFGERLAKQFKYNSSLDSDYSFYNCFNIEKTQEKNKLKMKKNKPNISKREIHIDNNNSNNKLDDKFLLDESQIDVEDTIKGEDNINITKLNSINKKIVNKKKKLILNNQKKGLNKNLNKIPLNNANKKNVNKNNNTFIKKKSNINVFNTSYSKKKINSNTMKNNMKTKTNSNIKPFEYLDSTIKLNKNKSKQNKTNFRIKNNNYSDDDLQIKNYYDKKLSKNKRNINQIDNINNSREIIRSIKNNIQKERIYGINNNIIIKKNKYK